MPKMAFALLNNLLLDMFTNCVRHHPRANLMNSGKGIHKLISLERLGTNWLQ